ncbi:MAG TPA: Trp family transcriptional regulator [Patescibacteria group bacterium]
MKNTASNELAQAIKTFNTDKELVAFLEGILTPQELMEISTRLQIVKQLMQGIPQRQIAERLNVGIATVTRGSRVVKQGLFNSWRNSDYLWRENKKVTK